MSIASVILRGFGNGTVSGSISGVILRGYTLGEEVAVEVTGPALGVSSLISLTVGTDGSLSTTMGSDGDIDLTLGVD